MTTSIIDEVKKKAEYEALAPKALMVQSAINIDKMALQQNIMNDRLETGDDIFKVLKKDCPKLNPKAIAHHEDHVEEIEAKGKVKMAIAQHWGKITITVVGMFIAFLGGSYIGIG